MRSALCAVLFVGSLFAVAANEVEEDSYATLEARLKAGDTSINFAVLRMAFAETEAYSPLGNEDREARARMYDALDEEDYEKALKEAEQALEKYYLFGDAHLVARVALRELGQQEASDFHLDVVRGLYHSICVGTDGRSVEKPCKVLNVAEEYFYLRISELEVRGQSLIGCGDGRCDAMKVYDATTEEEFTVYFDVSLQMNYLNERTRGK